jgi:phosphomannomutase
MSKPTTNYPDEFNLFKQYDIRGKSSILTPDLAYFVGVAVYEYLTNKGFGKVLTIMRDGRRTSKDLYDSFCSGFEQNDGEIISLGLGSTDMLYTACQLYSSSGCMVTASHNPADYNGFKLVSKIPNMIGLGSGLEEIRDKALEYYSISKEEISIQSFSEISQDSVVKDFQSKLKIESKLSNSNNPINIVVDAFGGVGSVVYNKVFEPLQKNLTTTKLNFEIDPDFTKHSPNPSEYKNLAELQHQVIKSSAGFGVAFDGDADRVFFVDDLGEVVHADFVTGLFAEYYLTKNPTSQIQNTIIVPYTSSQVITDTIIRNKGKYFQTRQGHSYLTEGMSENNGVFGGEYSGHFYFWDFNYMDSGVFALQIMVNILRTYNQSLSTILQPIRQKYFISECLNIMIPTNIDLDTIKTQITAHFPDCKVTEEDGVIIKSESYFISIRKSNTEPLLRIIVNSMRVDCRKEKMQKVVEIINNLI